MERKMVTHHRIIIDDSRNLTKYIVGEKVHLVVTSPPYWKLKDYGSDQQIGKSATSYEEYLNSIFEVLRECVKVLTPGGKLCINIMPIFLSGDFSSKFRRRITKTVLTDLEFLMCSLGNMFFHSLYIWDKRKIVRFSSFGSYPYPPNLFSTFPYEWIIVFSKTGKRPPVSKEQKEKSRITQKEWAEWCVNSIWEMQPASAEQEGHPAPFPEELPRRIIKLYSFVGDTVLDPFLGSGTTTKVAIELHRNSIGFEINPDYLPIIKRKVGYGLRRLDEEVSFEIIEAKKVDGSL
jgi:site-specific DNA-methyltransferase (adenine-specific)